MAKAKTKDAGDQPVSAISLDGHPRAVRGVRRFRAAAGLLGFVVGAWLAHAAGLPVTDVLQRALIVGIVAHLCGWVLAIGWWRAVIVAELESLRQRHRVAREAADSLLRETAQASSGH